MTGYWLHDNGITGIGNWNFGSHQSEDKVTIYGSLGTIQFSVLDDQPIQLKTEKGYETLNILNPENVQTNMVFMGLPDGAADGLRHYLSERGILLGGGKKQIRLVTHLNVTRDDVDLLIEQISEYFA